MFQLQRAIQRVALAGVISALAGCAPVGDAETSSVSTEPSQSASRIAFSDQDIFRGVILGGGDVAKRIPTIQTHIAPALAKTNARVVDSVHAALLAQVAIQDPGAISALGDAVRRRDHYAVEAGIKRGVTAIVSVLESQKATRGLIALARNPERARVVMDSLRKASVVPADQLSTVQPTADGEVPVEELTTIVAGVVAAVGVYVILVVHVGVLYNVEFAMTIHQALALWDGDPTEATITMEQLVADVVGAQLA